MQQYIGVQVCNNTLIWLTDSQIFAANLCLIDRIGQLEDRAASVPCGFSRIPSCKCNLLEVAAAEAIRLPQEKHKTEK